MNYALGSSFNMDDMFMNFSYKKLKVTCKQCKEINGDEHRDKLVKRIFKDCVKIVLEDVILNGVTFNLPTGSRPADIHVFSTEGEDFKTARRNGKFKGIDYLTTYFKGYDVGLFMYGSGRTRRKIVYMDKRLKELFYEVINSGYTYSKVIYKSVSDYYLTIHDLYPELLISDIKRILNFGWKSLYLHNSYGGDTIIAYSDLWCFIGTLRRDSLKHFLYYIKKLTVKLRVLYKRNKTLWDGYYYFALSDSLYNDYTQLKKKRGRPRKIFKYGNLVLYKLLDECKIKEYNRKYIFKIPYLADLGFTFYKENLISGEAELIIERDSLKFKDILVTNNKYSILHGTDDY